MSTSLVLADLNTEVNHEPRVADLRLAEVLGFVDRHMIRRLIDRHQGALERFGAVSVTRRKPGPGGGRPGKEFWLNRKQAIFITAKSDTPTAAEVTIQMVEVFDAWLSGQIAAAPLALAADLGRAQIQTPPLAPGLMHMMVGSRLVVVDANNFAIRRGDEALVCSHDGRLQILKGPLEPAPDSALGTRAVWGPWHKSKMSGARERVSFTVLGRVAMNRGPIGRGSLPELPRLHQA